VAAGFVLLVGVVAGVLLAGGGEDEGGGSPPSTAAPVATKLPADLAWQPIASPEFRRQYAAATAVGGKLMVVGGIGVKASSTTTKVYEPETGRWSTGPGLPVPLHHAAAVTYRGDAVVIGGFVPGDELTSGQSDRVYVLRGDSWKRLPSLNHARAAAAAAVVGGKMVVVGGQADGKLVRQTEVFDGERWTDAAAMPTPREHLAAASDGRYLYAVGGRDLTAAANLPALERYDPANDSWTKLDDMPRNVGSVGVAYVRGRVLAVGGEGITHPFDAVQAFDVTSNRWSPLPALPAPRHGVAVTGLGNSLYAIGGARAAGHVQATDAVDVLDLD